MTILGCGAEMAKLMAVSDEDVQTIEDVLKERMDMGIARPEAQRQAVAEAIAIVTNERAVVMGAIAAKVAALQKAAEPIQATHQDPGAAPEAATSPVIAESLEKAAKKEERPLAEMKAELLGMIDAAVKLTPDYQDHMAAIEKVGKDQADAIYTGLNYRNSQKTVEGKASITFDVPGDGKFRVTNSYAGLMAFRGKIDKASGNGFSATKRPGLPASTSVKKGSTNQISAVESMLEDGDLQAAKDYMAAVGIGTDGLSKSALARMDQLEELGDKAQEALYTRIDPAWEYSVDRGSRRATLTRTIGKDVYRASVIGSTHKNAPDDFKTATYGISKNNEKEKPGSAGNFHDALVMVQASLDKLADKAGTESQAKDTGWNMAGTGYAGKRYSGRNMTLEDGREVVARIYENAGVYEEAEVKVDGKRVFAVTDRNDAQGKADDFIKTLTSAPAELNLMGFTKTPTGNGTFTLSDSNMRVTVEPTGTGFQARMGSGTSGPRLTEQQAVEWAASMRDESIRIQKAEAKAKPEVKATTPISTAKEPWQMTEAEFGEVERQKALAIVKYDLERAKNGSLKPFVSGDKSKPALVRRLTAEVAQIESAKPEGYAGDHLAQINKALREGKPVPEVNLKRYDIAAPKAEQSIANQTFDQWVRQSYEDNEYKATYLKESDGDEKIAMLRAVTGWTDADAKPSDILKEARRKYFSKLTDQPREASISLEVFDALPPAMQTEAQQHFYDLDGRLTRRTQDETSARVKAENAAKKPYEDALAEVSSEIARLDKISGPETQKQKDLSGRRARLEEAIWQIGQGKEPDGRLLKKDAPTQEPATPEQKAPANTGLTYPLAPAGTRYEETSTPITMMTPDAYLAEVRPLDIDEASRDNIDDLKAHILSGKTLDPLHIRADGKEDGRHRAVAAKELGIAQVPVVDARASKAEPSKIENFGVELPPARRTIARQLSESLSNDDIARLPLSQVWPALEIDAIEDPFVAAAASVMREVIPAKPRTAYKVKAWAEKVQLLRSTTAKLVAGTVTRERFIEKMGEVYSLRQLLAKIKLLEKIDRTQWSRIGDVQEWPDATKYVDGKSVPVPQVSLVIDDRRHDLQGSGDIATHMDAIAALLAGDAKEKRMAFEIRGSGTSFFINKTGDKQYRHLMEFTSVKDARDALENRYKDVVAAWEAVKERDNITERDLRSDVNRARAGRDWRNGKDVTAEEFQQQFGFRGGEFGKWVSQGKGAQERQFFLNSAYDALMDLADILGIPPRAISLEGTLGIAFGSRGSGWASAHFEPSNLVINLTKPRGAGALAHEWFHALDNYFARKRNDGQETPIRAGMGAQQEYRGSNYITHRTTPMMVRKDGRGGPVTKERLAEWLKYDQGRSAYLDASNWIEDPKHKQGVRAEVEERFENLVKTLNESPMSKRARLLDGVKESGDGYWSRTLERAARSFENYIQSQMLANGYHNDFLANVRDAAETKKSLERYPYLMPSEIAPIADAFASLFDTIQTRETGDGNVAMFSRAAERNDTTGFYSALAREIDALPTKAAPAPGWQMAIQGMVKNGKVKADELEWSGLTDWLKLQTGKVTKEAVLNYLDANGVQVQEVQSPVGESIGTQDFTKLTLPGGENYREVLLTLPQPSTERTPAEERRLAYLERNGYGDPNDPTVGDELRAEVATLRAKNTASESYTSAHWNQKNVLAHIRVNDRTDADGKRVLFVEEIQSDWGQQGKKDGFNAPVEMPDGTLRTPTTGVPIAPFVTNTDKWLNLALKRIITMAVEGGYDKIAFVNGEQSADRYDLSKQVDSISVYQRDGEGGDYRVSVYPKGSNQPMDGLRDRRMTANELADHVGKELADKIARGDGGRETADGRTWFRGIDLKVGGEGMKTFYDQIVPNAVKALAKKLGGEIGQVEIDNREPGSEAWFHDLTEDDTLWQPGLTITDTMREKAAGGLPLFTRQNGSIPASFGAQYGNTQPADPQALAAVDSLNDALRRYFGSNDYGVVLQPGRDGGVSRAVEEAIRVAFGKRVVPVAAAPGNRDVFNGFQIPSRPNDVFVNVNARVGFVNIAGHELWHSIERQRPDLIAWYREQSRGFYKDLPAYRDRLNALLQAGERQYTDKTALSELEADFLGDSLTDRDFLQSLADASPSKFKALLTHVGEWLNKVLGKLKGLGSAKEVTDVQALRGYLKNVLVAFAEGKDIPQAPAGVAQGVSFNRANDERAMADAAAIAAATDPFWEKERISAIRREFDDEYSNDGKVDGRQIDTETGVERDEDGDVTPAGDEEIWRRAQAAIDAATSERAGILSDLDDIDAGGTHMQAYHAAQAWLDAMGVAYQEIRSAGSRYLEIHSADYVEGKETESANKSLKLRFASHQNQSRSHTSTDLNWVEGGQDAALSDMLDAALRFSQGEVGLGEKVNFSRAHSARQFSPTARAQAVKAVEYTASTIRSAWANAPEVIVAFDMGDPVVPASARRADEKQRSGGAKGAPEGFYYKGKVYLMASQLKTPADTARVLFHEALGHHGLRGAFGKDLDNVLRQIATMRRAQVDAKVKEYGLRGVSNLDLLTAAEEVLAEMAQTTPEIGFVKRAVAAIRTWLRTHVPWFKNLALTDAEIIRSYILPARGWVENGEKNGGGVFGGVAFMRVWHGSPHRFLKFDSSKIGTGEGAQAYGHGLYFAESPDVAGSYQRMAGVELRDKTGKTVPMPAEAEWVAKDLAAAGGDYAKVRASLVEHGKTWPWPAEMGQRRLAEWEKAGLVPQAQGALYKVDLPDEAIAKMLDYDRPLEDQAPAVKEALKRAGLYDGAARNVSGNVLDDITAYISKRDGRITTKLKKDKAAAADTLRQAGIPGIRYLDGGSRAKTDGELIDVYQKNGQWFSKIKKTPSGQVGDVIPMAPVFTTSMPFKSESEARQWAQQQIGGGTYNYVIFPGNEHLLTILDINGVPVSQEVRDDVVGNALDEQDKAAGGLPMFSRADQTMTTAFKAWFGDSKVVDADGKPLVVYHGTKGDFDVFGGTRDDGVPRVRSGVPGGSDVGAPGGQFWFTTDPQLAFANGEAGSSVMPVYVRIENPIRRSGYFGMDDFSRPEKFKYFDKSKQEWVTPDGVIGDNGVVVAFRPEQIKSAIGNNGQFDPANPDIRFSRAATARDLTQKASDAVRVFTNTPGKVNWWHKTVGTQYNLAQRSPEFKRVYDAVQDFIGDVSFYATEAADLAPKILPKLDTWRDIAKSPLSADDTKAIAAPIFEGTLVWARNEAGQPVKVAQLEEEAALMSPDRKAQRLLRNDKISEGVLKMWRGLPMEQYEALIDGKYEKEMLKAGLVWSDAELRSQFALSDDQIALYREFRAATDKSLTNLAISDMLYFGGKDVAPIKEAVLEAKTVTEAAEMLRDYLLSLADMDPDNAESLIATANKMIDKGDRAADLMARGYAPLSRFGTYTLDVVDADGERVYFGLFESRFEADRMAKQMTTEYPGSTVEQGTLSEESYKLFAGVSPETVALFGDMLGLEDNGAYQDYLKLAKSTRSAMKRLIERKGIAGFSEDAGRVLAGFVYSNARQTSQNMHTGEMVQAANDIPKGMGELKDKATQLVEYIKHPVEEAQKVRGLLFAQYIGGSVASAMVNMTQPFTMTMPWLSQFGGLSKAAKQMSAAVKDATRKTTGNPALDAALKRGEEDGTVSPQEVHDLMRQAQGKGALKSGDGTKMGDATAIVQNAVSRIAFAWGKLFSTAEQFNRRVTFIAAYRTAVEQGMKNPDAFARRAIHETQGVYNKGNKPDWARGAVGSTLFTFKQYSIAYVEMLHRMATTGAPGSPERAAGRRGALYALAVLVLLSGVGGLPGADDLDDIISGLMQSLGYNFDSKAKRKAFLAEYLGDGAQQFIERGVSGIYGVPIDVSGRLGLGNLVPATGLLTKKTDHTSDVAELLGPAGDLAKRGFQAGGKLIEGDILGNHGAIATASPKAVQNLFQAADMATTGMYRDARGKKVIETSPGDALSKALGFQPNDVKRQQDATWEVKRMVDLNRITEAEIAERWAIGLFEKDADKVQAARDDLARWNADNPDSPISIKFSQILQRVRSMNQTKAERIAKTAPKELRAQVREALGQQ